MKHGYTQYSAVPDRAIPIIEVVVTYVALQTRRTMITWKLVACGTGTIDLVMVNGKHRHPAIGTMTGLAAVGGINMPPRQTVATGTGAQHLGMIHGDHRRPAGSAVAGLTHGGCIDVARG